MPRTSESNISPAYMNHLNLAGENVVLSKPKCHLATLARHSCEGSGARERVATFHAAFSLVKWRG